MLFHIKQSHTPENCPYQRGGSRSLQNHEAAGISVKAMYLDFPGHNIFMIVEANSVDALQQFLAPGVRTCTTEITPVATESVKPA